MLQLFRQVRGENNLELLRISLLFFPTVVGTAVF